MKSDYWRLCGELVVADLAEKGRKKAAEAFRKRLPDFESCFAKVTLAGKFESSAELSGYINHTSTVLAMQIGAGIGREIGLSGAAALTEEHSQRILTQLATELPRYVVQLIKGIGSVSLTKDELTALEMWSEYLALNVADVDAKVLSKRVQENAKALLEVMMNGREAPKSNHLKLVE